MQAVNPCEGFTRALVCKAFLDDEMFVFHSPVCNLRKGREN